ncbi:MAG: isoprenylcysteine carboxylmethyltransferase family protein [Xanthobacteraceae bacterium]
MPMSAYLQSAAFFALAGVALFASAGTVAIATYWVYLGILAAVFAASLLGLDPDLARERMRPGGKRPPAVLQLFSAVLFAHWTIAGLDHGRFHWSDGVPIWLQAVSLVALAAGYGLCFWAMRVNRFFSSVVRIQSDRGHVVIISGPYAFIRHPGYLAGIIVIVSSGIALASWLATAFLVVAALPFLLARAIGEDRVLLAQLPGYRDYAARVRWRLVPGVW